MAFGKGLEDAGDYRRAFEEYRKGNGLKRSKTNYDEAAAEATFRHLSASFDSALFEKRNSSGHPSQAPVFIIGMPRSGTSLAEQVLASHPEVYGAGELDTIGVIVRAALTQSASADLAAFLTREVLWNMAAQYLASLPSSASRKRRSVNKLPGNFLYAGVIHLMFPNATIIHITRNPLDTCVSCYATLFDQGHSYSYELSELGRYYKGYSALMAHWRSAMPAGRILDVSYEEMIGDFDGQARRMVAHCGLAWHDRCLEFHRTKRPVYTASLGQVRQPLYSTSVGRASRFAGMLEPLVSALKPPAVQPDALRTGFV
jgi:hypothetical protein